MSSALPDSAGVWIPRAENFPARGLEAGSRDAPRSVKSKGLRCKASWAASLLGPVCLSLPVPVRAASYLSSASTRNATVSMPRVRPFLELEVHLVSPSNVSTLSPQSINSGSQSRL